MNSMHIKSYDIDEFLLRCQRAESLGWEPTAPFKRKVGWRREFIRDNRGKQRYAGVTDETYYSIVYRRVD